MMIAALLAGALTLFYQFSAPAPATVEPIANPIAELVPTGQVVVARIPIQAYSEPIQKKHVKEVPYPEEHLPDGAAPNLEEVLGKIPKEDILDGEIVMLPRLKTPGQKDAGISGLLKVNERAITLEVDGITAAGGFIQQGDIVDVIAMYPASADQQIDVKTVLSNIKILAVGAAYQTSVARGPGNMVQGNAGRTRITLAVPAIQANQIMHLNRRASYRLILKNPKDTTIPETDGASYAQLIKENVAPRFRNRFRTANKVLKVHVISQTSESYQNVVVPVQVRDG